MFGKLFDSNEKQLKKLTPLVDKVNSLESKFSGWSQEAIKDQTNEWRALLQKEQPTSQGDYLNDILPEAFALVRESAKRTLKQRHYDVQLMAGIVLHQGKIAEQKTGEGKTLTATLPLYLNSLTGRGAHLVTPNDYLSRHGAGLLGSVYNYLGVSVGVVMEDRAFIYDSSFESSEFKDQYSKNLREVPRQQAYKCDVVYGTNHQFGFDYLRDNMAFSLEEMVQTNPIGEWGVHNFAIVDEADSILIDVARTPLIISTSGAQATARYHDANRIVKQLVKGTDFEVEEKFRNVTLTDLGVRRVEKMLGARNIYEEDFEIVHLIEQSLTAYALYEKDRDYVVKDGKVVIVDQFTGRLLPSNRFSQGLHQAIEAKENVDIQQENRTRAEISYQNYFRMYNKLSGMTGTAVTEAEELYKIYKLDVVVLPTNNPVVRKDFNDVVYKTEGGKFKAVADEIVERNKVGQPVLVGTTSVEKSEILHSLLERRKIPHRILNAKNHEEEALIIAQAGRKGAVTISTNMAGRGVDIILGGDPPDPVEHEDVKSAGGLHVIGTERHESRRIDNQLRGRSGRQGDPGSSRFYISLQDDLMRIFGGAQVESIMNRMGLDDSTPLEASLVSKAIENAQKKVEGLNFDRRKQIVEMDDVMNVHREVIYKLRRRVLDMSSGNDAHKEWFYNKLVTSSKENELAKVWEKFEKDLGEKHWTFIVGQMALPVIDVLWMEHLVDMSHLRDGIGLRGYAQKDPIVEYKREGHERFDILIGQLYGMIVERITRIENVNAVPSGPVKPQPEKLDFQHGELESGVSDEKQLALKDNLGRKIKVEKVTKSSDITGRNDPCPCGSGLKYKKCGLINASSHKKG